MLYLLKSLLKVIYLKIRKTLLLPFLLCRKTKVPSKREIMRILFLRHDRIGDMVLSTAALRALKRAHPEARITVLASKRNYEIIQNNPHIDEKLVYSGLCWFIKEMRGRTFDLAIDSFYTYEFKQAFVAYMSRAKYRIGFEEAGREIFFDVKGPGLYPIKHFVDHLLELVAYLGADVSGCKPELFLSSKEIRWAADFLSDKGINTNKLTVAIHPGAYYKSNMWPSDRFALVAKKITNELQTNVIAFGGHGEEAILDKIKQRCRDDVFIVSNISIRQLMAILSRCNLFIGNNSGPLHIAAALGLPTVSTIGPPLVPLWLPYGKNHIVLRKDLDCSPCNRDVCKDHRCMKLITVDEVFEAVKSQIIDLESKRKKTVVAQGKGRKLKKS
jgi:lipopolysaccharide heptosyltransferase II